MDVERLLDAEIAALLAGLPPLPTFTLDGLAAIRSQRRVVVAAAPLSDDVERREVVAPHDGAPDVPMRIHRPVGQEGALPCIYWMHAGGFVTGSYKNDDARFDRWCRRLNCVGVSVEYRLSPECAYPGPVEDCYAGLRWIHDHALELGIDVDRLGVAGASAGGGLAAAVALMARDRGEIPVAFQLLIYPMLDDRQVTESSQWEVPVWPPASNRFGWSAYLGPRYGSDVPAYAAPARAVDLAGLPPALVVVGALDGFVDEDVAFAQRLNWAGVPAELHLYPGAPHGFEGYGEATAVSARAQGVIDDWLARVLAPELTP
jgi:acetyl esterase/lipase